jgi:hypothetical protein
MLAVVPFMMTMLVAGCGEKAGRSEIARLLPDPGTMTGVRAMGEISEYEGATLYDFLNGGAELYFDYGIVSVASAEYGTIRDKAIEVSVYDMGRPAGAFGIYSNIRYAGAEFVAVGNEGMLTASSLDFWKGRYYCRLLAFDMDVEAQAAMLGLGEALAGNIAAAGSAPDIVNLLPEDHRVARSEKYFTKPIGLNNIRYISSENVLNLGDGTEGVAAAYEADGTAFTVFVIKYVSEDDAGGAFDSYRAHLGDEPGALVGRRGVYMAGVWDLEGKPAADVLESVLAGLERQP